MTASAARVRVSTGARLHFGLWGLSATNGPQFGGIGAMIDQPATRIELTPADRLEIVGEQVARVRNIVQHAFGSTADETVRARIHVLAAAPAHSGLGSGTQLTLAVLTGLKRLLDLAATDAVGLARSSGRGQRSAVGTHGFVKGGFLYDPGRLPPEPLAADVKAYPIPESWRILLICPRGGEGLSGSAEREAFAQLSDVSASTTRELRCLADDVLIPSVMTSDFAQFSAALGEYNRRAGELFSAAQGGPYASAWHAGVIDHLRSQGIQGVGQSSWGPTLFAVVESPQAAETLYEALKPQSEAWNAEILVTRPLNRGAEIVVEHRSRDREGAVNGSAS